MSDRTYVPIEGGPNPSDLPHVGAIIPPVPDPGVAPPTKRTYPGDSLVASAARILGSGSGKGGRGGGGVRGGSESWQEDAWEMYDLVGEMRFLTNVTANQAAKARFYVGTLADDPTDPPIPTQDQKLIDALEAIGNGPTGLAQIIKRLFINLEVPGDGYLVGIPHSMTPEGKRERAAALRAAEADSRLAENVPPIQSLSEVTLDDLDWKMLSISEVQFDNEDVTFVLGEDDDEKVKTKPDNVYMIRIWNPHPRKSWEADSATRSALPILRELVGLTMHISAQIDSRLAGAGVLLVPTSASKAAKIALGFDPEGPEDPFTDALIEAMITPISDRANASAHVPLVWVVPDESEPRFRFMSFAKELDSQAKDMRDEAIRRYALSADAPPELLLGVGSMNHWGAWLVQEDVVRAHLEPPLAVVAQALTTQYLHPIMEQNGYDPDEIENHVVWFDVEHLIVRVTRRDEAREAYLDGVISAQAYRDAGGFSEDDAPEVDSTDPAVSLALEMVAKAPSLMGTPGLPELVRQIRLVMSGDEIAPPAAPVDPNAEAPADAETPEEDAPAPEGPPEPPAPGDAEDAP